MKCINHPATDAVAVCPYCGRALCPACIPMPMATRMTCSDACETGLAQGTRAVQLLLAKSVQSARANSFYNYICGGLSAAAAVAAWFLLPSPFLIYFTAGCAVVFCAAGYWHGRGEKSPAPTSNSTKAEKIGSGA